MHVHTNRALRGGPLVLCAGLAAAALAAPGAGSLGAPSAPQTATDGSFAETRVEVPRSGAVLALRDLTGDGRKELVEIDGGSLRVRRLGANGEYETGARMLPWTGKKVGWDLADLDGSGRTDLIVVVDGESIARRRYVAGEGWSDPEELFTADVYLPSGVARVPFARDVDRDGRIDLVLPGAGRFDIRLNLGVGDAGRLDWSDSIQVEYEPEIDYELGDPERLSSTFGQSVRVPLFSIEDVDGDGRQDLVSEMDDRVAFHLADPTIAALPTWELDLSELKNDVSASDVDLDDLLSAVAGFAQWRVEDLDGVAPNDLIIGSDGTFRVYLGASRTGPTGDPDQVLRSSGNTLYFFVRDVIGDGRPDLQIVRGERISLARLLKYLVVPGRLDFDVFTYQNDDGRFARRPTKRTTIALRVPRLLGMIDEFDDMSDELEAQWDIPATRLDWDGDGEEDDVVDAVGGQLRVFLDCAPEEQRFENISFQSGFDGIIERVVLRDLDALDDGGETVIDLGELNAFAVAPGKVLRDSTSGRTAVAAAPLWEGDDDRSVRPLDLDGDGRLDLVTVVDGPNSYRLQFLVRAPR